MHTFCLALIDGKYYLKVTKENGTLYISGSDETPEEKAGAVTAAYGRKLASGYEQYASACIHNLFFNYSFFSLDDNTILELFLDINNINAVNISHVSGFFSGYEVQNTTLAKELFDNGIQPHMPLKY